MKITCQGKRHCRHSQNKAFHIPGGNTIQAPPEITPQAHRHWIMAVPVCRKEDTFHASRRETYTSLLDAVRETNHCGYRPMSAVPGNILTSNGLRSALAKVYQDNAPRSSGMCRIAAFCEEGNMINRAKVDKFVRSLCPDVVVKRANVTASRGVVWPEGPSNTKKEIGLIEIEVPGGSTCTPQNYQREVPGE